MGATRMRGLVCQDGSSLTAVPVVVRDREGAAYEVVLELRRDGELFGTVGERCGHRLAALVAAVTAARADDSCQADRWGDPDDRFPDRAGAFDSPGCEDELFAFRRRERADAVGAGELRCTLRSSAVWVEGVDAGRGRWRFARRAVVEAWGSGGRGVRAVLTSGELVRFLVELRADADRTLRRTAGVRWPRRSVSHGR